MKKLLFLLLALPMSAQTITLLPNTAVTVSQTLVVWDGAYKSFRADVHGVADTGVNWTTTGGTLVGNTTCTESPCRIAIYSATNGTFTVTATAHASGSVTASQAIQFNGSPTKIQCSSGAPDTSSCHPRFLITPSMIAALQAKATAGNPMYQSMLAGAVCQFTGSGSCGPPAGGLNGIWNWSCGGGPGNTRTGLPTSDQSGSLPEIMAYVFAQMAIIDPSDATYNWKCYARDMWVYTENAVVAGKISFHSGTEWSQQSENFALTNDLLEYTGYLSSADMNTFRAYAAYALQDLLENNSYGGGSPQYNNWNSVSQLQNDLNQRGVASNYTESKMLLISALSSTTDDNTTDDPALTNTCSATRYQVCPDFTAGSLHAYWAYYTGAWLFKWYGHAEDPTISAPAYNAAYGGFSTQPQCPWSITGVNSNCLGDGVGGESSEGSGYWWHVYTFLEALTLVRTAGLDDPLSCIQENGTTNACPQMSLEFSSWTDEELMSQLAFLKFYGSNGNSVSPGYTFLETGDAEDYVTNPSYQLWATAMMILDQSQGRTDRTNAELWPVLNTAYGGPLGTTAPPFGQPNCSSHCGYISELNNSYAQDTAWPMMISQPAADPTTSLPSDPRPNYPTDIWNDSYNQHQSARNGWATTNAAVSVYDGNAIIDHEHEYQGGFEVDQNNEYLTKRRVIFDTDYNDAFGSAPFNNTYSVLNTLPAPDYAHCFNDDWGAPVVFGGQFFNDAQAGLTKALHSELPTYIANHVDDTNAYNGCPEGGAFDYTDVSQAVQDFLWIRGSNQIIRYGRSTTSASSNKSDFIITTGAITVTSNAASWLTRSGTQKANYSTLLPTGINPTALKLVNYLVLSAPYATLQSSTSMQMVCTAYYADGTNANVSADPNTYWNSGTPANVSVSSSGLASAVGSVGGQSDIGCVNNGVAVYQQGAYSDGYVTVGSSSSGTFSGRTNTSQTADWEPYAQIRVNGGNTPSTQFLSTFEWGANTFTPTTPTLVQSSSGQGYDCAKIGTSMGCFMRSIATFTGTTYAASGATTHYISDLTPDTSYAITGVGTPSTATTDNAGVLTFSATGTGNITVGSFTPPAVSGLLGVTLNGAGVQ